MGHLTNGWTTYPLFSVYLSSLVDPLFLVGALYLSQQVYDILFVQDNVANFMHIVGGACGTVFGFAVRRK